MSTITFNLKTACNFLNHELFAFYFAEDICRAVKQEASEANMGVDEYLSKRFPMDEVLVDSQQAQMTRVFLDKLSRAEVVL